MHDTRKPVAAVRGSAAITREIEKAILEGEYRYGDRLPAERQLAGHFQTSRNTVREALQQLEKARLVSRRMGSGTFVTYTPQNEEVRVAEITSPLQLVDVRFAIEPQMARLAVLNANVRDLEALEQALVRVEKETVNQDAFSRADEKFHLALAQCSGNPLLVWLYQQINIVRGQAEWNAMKSKILLPERIAQYNHEHRALFEAIKSRDKQAAERIILQHLNRAKNDLIGAEAT